MFFFKIQLFSWTLSVAGEKKSKSIGISKAPKKFKAARHTREDEVSRVPVPNKRGTEKNLTKFALV